MFVYVLGMWRRGSDNENHNKLLFISKSFSFVWYFVVVSICLFVFSFFPLAHNEKELKSQIEIDERMTKIELTENEYLFFLSQNYRF